MSKNNNLVAAKRAKNDEFYTLYRDVEAELVHYGEHFRGKTIYCNCDDPDRSAFWKYFSTNFERLGLKRLLATYLQEESTSAFGEEMCYVNGCLESRRFMIAGNGDFASQAAVRLLDASDMVVTNPPFSEFRSILGLLMRHKKKFLLIGNMNAINYREVFPLLKAEMLWLGYTAPKEFVQEDGSTKKFGNIIWFTNLDVQKRHEPLPLSESYSAQEYPKYDNFDAINVTKVSVIPKDYDGVMGVPMSYLTKHCPEQFEIVGMASGNTRLNGFNYKVPYTPTKADRGGVGLLNGKRTYARILIKRKGN